MLNPKLRVLISAEKIQARVLEMGEQIRHDYSDGPLHMICILKGGVFFMTDLARAIGREVFVDFMGISTYGQGKSSSGEVKVTKDLDISLEGADVLIVEDGPRYSGPADSDRFQDRSWSEHSGTADGDLDIENLGLHLLGRELESQLPPGGMPCGPHALPKDTVVELYHDAIGIVGQTVTPFLPLRYLRYEFVHRTANGKNRHAQPKFLQSGQHVLLNGRDERLSG
jgi:hypothetical protein